MRRQSPRVGPALFCPRYELLSVPAHVLPTVRSSAVCKDVRLTDYRRAEALSTTAELNSGESSTRGVEAMHITLA